MYIKVNFIILNLRYHNCKQVVNCIKPLFQCTLKMTHFEKKNKKSASILGSSLANALRKIQSMLIPTKLTNKNCMTCYIFRVAKSSDDN